MRNFRAMEDQWRATIEGRQPLYLVFASSAHTANGVAQTGSNYKMKPTDQVIIATSSESDGTALITLPSKAEAVGRIYSILAPTGASGGDISVYDKESGSEWTTEGDLDADADNLICFCNGKAWVALNSPA